MDQQRIEDQVLRVAITEAIANRIRDRRWYRAQTGYEHYYRDVARENDTRLRELLRVRRLARSIAAPIVEREDAISRSKAAALAAGDHYRYAAAEGAPTVTAGQMYEGMD